MSATFATILVSSTPEAVDSTSPIAFTWEELGNWSGSSPGFLPPQSPDRRLCNIILSSLDALDTAPQSLNSFEDKFKRIRDWSNKLESLRTEVAVIVRGSDRSWNHRAEDSIRNSIEELGQSNSRLGRITPMDVDIYNSGAGGDETPKVQKKRRRLPLSCEQCRKRKVK
jgi:hypothetical protein